ncbi:signal peptidase I [Sphingomonas sp.]|uniref:signal peptidase I n=1 Tax=Sphingomonas sp. TaxID=28214 RepID=UPI002EDA57A8
MAEELALTAENEAGTEARAGRTDWWAEAKGIFWLVIAVLGFHSLVAKPFYIPSESMMPTLLIGDRLVVTKYPYGYSYVTPTFHVLPFIKGRLLGSVPRRGDIVIVTPPDARTDYIKRVIGLPGDLVEMHGGLLYINGRQVKREKRADRLIPIDANTRCGLDTLPGERNLYEGRVVRDASGKQFCNVPIVRETLPEGASYDTIDLAMVGSDNFSPVRIPAGHVWLMGDNRDNSADSRMTLDQGGLGGAVPVENIGGRAEFVTFSLDGSASWNPLSWAGSFRPGRAGGSLHPDRPAE